jgi:hypothetical protein
METSRLQRFPIETFGLGSWLVLVLSLVTLKVRCPVTYPDSLSLLTMTYRGFQMQHSSCLRSASRFQLIDGLHRFSTE